MLCFGDKSRDGVDGVGASVPVLHVAVLAGRGGELELIAELACIALAAESFLSGASFQESTNVVTEATVRGAVLAARHGLTFTLLVAPLTSEARPLSRWFPSGWQAG